MGVFEVWGICPNGHKEFLPPCDNMVEAISLAKRHKQDYTEIKIYLVERDEVLSLKGDRFD